MKQQTVYVVLSRDKDFVSCASTLKKAKSIRDAQEEDEVMSGNFAPSVYIKKTVLIK